MKNILLLTLLFSTVNVSAQKSLLTIGEVFDYEIGDKFHSKSLGPQITPNAYRSEVLNKYYSASNDTVFYVFYSDNYETEFFTTPDYHLEYTFETSIDTIFYTNLDSCINTYHLWKNNDSIYSHYDFGDTLDQDFCNYLTNWYVTVTDTFEPSVESRRFGKGLGQLRYTNYVSSSVPIVDFTHETFYFKKGNFECGTPDTITSAKNLTKNKFDFKIFPNPANDYFIINKKSSDNNIYKVYVLNNLGQIIKKLDFNSNLKRIDISNLEPSYYILRITDTQNNNSISKSFIKK